MPQVLIITGMHRSGTSMVSNLLQAGGADIGSKLLPANGANPHGYFEDLDFYEFHEDLLSDRHQHAIHIDRDFEFEATEADRQRAQSLCDARAHLAFWAWKDPRTSLFLDFWHQQLPDAKFLFLYRHPLEVLLSLLRRGEFSEGPHLTAGLQAWWTYNAKIKSFYERNPDRCLLVHINGLTAHFEQFVRLMGEKLHVQLSLDTAAFDRIYRTKELGKLQFPREVELILDRVDPDLNALYRELNTRADLPADQNEQRAEAEPLVEALARFSIQLPELPSAAAQQSLLLLLSSLLAPDPTESMVQGSSRITKHHIASGRRPGESSASSVGQLQGFKQIYTAPAQMRIPERVALYALVFGVKPRHCLEIGTNPGGSSAIICGALDDSGFGQLTSIGPAPQMDANLWSQISSRCQMLEGASPETLPQAAESIGTSFDFALVDGNHSYDGVRADIRGVLPFMTDEGYLLFHDAHFDDVKRAIDDAITEVPELTDCGLISVERTFLEQNGEWQTWGGLRLVQVRRKNALRAKVVREDPPPAVADDSTSQAASVKPPEHDRLQSFLRSLRDRLTRRDGRGDDGDQAGRKAA